MVRIGVLGAGHLGKIHLKLIKEIDSLELVGFFDSDPTVRENISEQFGIKAFDDAQKLLAVVDAVDIVTPTTTHFTYGRQAINADKHIFIEKPITHTLNEAAQLRQMLLEKPYLKAQVGHVERFNPAFLAMEGQDLHPMFIEGHRLATYNPRGTDVSVVLDLMIHDLDIVLSMVKSPISQINASGVSVVSETPDIANARIEFTNGCVANLTASRISIKQMRRLRIFQKNAYLALDFLKKEAELLQLSDDQPDPATGAMSFEMDSGKDKKYLVFQKPNAEPVNAIKMELESFAKAIAENGPVPISVEDGYRALDAAHQIVAKIESLQRRSMEFGL
ncbi:MAG: Gfo/Idh/MocA family oxidoreductase [Bacteroidota bacterium]